MFIHLSSAELHCIQYIISLVVSIIFYISDSPKFCSVCFFLYVNVRVVTPFFEILINCWFSLVNRHTWERFSTRFYLVVIAWKYACFKKLFILVSTVKIKFSSFFKDF